MKKYIFERSFSTTKQYEVEAENEEEAQGELNLQVKNHEEPVQKTEEFLGESLLRIEEVEPVDMDDDSDKEDVREGEPIEEPEYE